MCRTHVPQSGRDVVHDGRTVKRGSQSRPAQLASEQAYLDAVYERAEQLVATLSTTRTAAGDSAARRAERKSRQARLETLEEALASDDLLYFGRLDYEDGHERDHSTHHYVGRTSILDGAADELVISWKSDVAAAYYQASRAANQGVARRRAFVGQRRLLKDLSDEVIGTLPHRLADDEVWGTPQDLLLAELERSRDGQMRDIISTIQADQDRLIRLPLETSLFVQGGPGTGKTAIGLHRASYLLFQHADRMGEDGLLVVAPNAVFLRYISQVLPGLGDDAVRHATVDSLGPRLTTTREEGVAAKRVKGDARMVDVITAYLQGRRGLVPRAPTQATKKPGARKNAIDEDQTEAPVEVLELAEGRYRLTSDQINAVVREVARTSRTYNGGRQRLRDELVSVLAGKHQDRRVDVARSLRRDAAFTRLLDRAWPSLSAAQVVADLLTGSVRLRNATKNLLTEAERKAIELPALERLDDMKWSASDVPLVDEAEAQLGGRPARTYVHLVLDEAQDLSPMQLRMLGRRCPSRSLTVLGDLAQGTSPWAPTTWDEVAAHLGIDAPTTEALTTGYRVPQEILETANELLPALGVSVPATNSIRNTGRTPQVEELDAGDLIPELVAHARSAAAEDVSTGIIIPEELYPAAVEACRQAKVRYGEADRQDLMHRVTLLTPDLTKGLEFDHVIVVRGGVTDDDPQRTARRLYVAMTRAVQDLTILEAPYLELPTPEVVHDMPDLDGVSYEVPAIRFEQDGVTLYVTTLPARVIADVGMVDTYKPDLPEDDPDQGYQREVVQSHAKQIARFLLDPAHSRLMPTAATLCARRPLSFTPVSHNGEAQSFGSLQLTRPIYIVDGQHRTAGFSLAADQDDEVAAFERPVVIMESVGKLDEIRQFQTINSTAKRVRTDLADRLLRQLGEFEDPTRSWKAVALDVADILNTTRGGVWRAQITMPNGARGIATQRTMTESLKAVVTGVLRQTDAPAIAGALNNYWDALRELMPTGFQEPKHYVLQKSVGVFAWHEVAAEVFLRCWADGRNFRTEKMAAMLRETGEYVDPGFWMTRARGGTAPNYGGRGGFSALAHEIIAALPAGAGGDGPISL
jgi:DGQHR domain-containing protein